jgi:histidine triad (HIT) family protein
MFNHEPAGYACPFCRLLAGAETVVNGDRDVILRTELATALVAPRWWPNNLGHVLVIPNAHHENLYDLPARYGHAVHDAIQQVAIAMRTAYDCAGISTRQHNEPAGDQEVWHYHTHVFPRYPDDDLYHSTIGTEFEPGPLRQSYADKLRAHLS